MERGREHPFVCALQSFLGTFEVLEETDAIEKQHSRDLRLEVEGSSPLNQRIQVLAVPRLHGLAHVTHGTKWHSLLLGEQEL
ncbi:hypothetical protein A7X91_02520 [Stenotrophomonas maltophilia]|nr:hypothetical protein A7X91_02520 [Stenotrophomonas maltophilia]